MTIKITTPNGGSDSLDFGCAQTPIVATVTGTEVSSGEGKLELKTTTSGTSATKVTILANGNVGIGTSAPNAPLHVVGLTRMQRDIDESSAYTGQLALNSVTKSAGQLARIMFSHDDHGSASIASDYESSGYGNLIFSTRGGGNPTERMRITSDGRGVSQFTARAWVNFNGTGTLSVRDSHNVSSVTDNGTGSYTVNIDNDMANINYSIALSASTDTAPTIVGTALTDWHPITNGYSYRTVGAFRVGTVNGSWSSFDPSSVNAQVFGD